jgi:4-hydroxy-tetrahydrodipicolinate reductase
VSAAERTAPLTRAVLIGVTGRMGRALLHAAPLFPRLVITGAVASTASPALGRDAGEAVGLAALNLPVTSDLPRALGAADVAIDFSEARAVGASLAACHAARTPLLIGTTGFGAELEAPLAAAARDIAVLLAPNTSVGVAVLTELTRRAARALPSTFDVNVLEVHHRLKQDAPSGTALSLARAAAEGRGVPPPAKAAAAAQAGSSMPSRREGEIGFAVLRAGDVIGEHSVLFYGVGEELSLTHRATDRAIFARGAIAAALWLASRPPGRYGMADFLDLKQ